MREVKVRFNATDLAVLDAAAAAAGVSRSELIRNRALVLNCDKVFTVADYHRLTSDATAYLRGDIPRRLVEHLVAFVITWTQSKSQPSNRQSSLA